ncbi:MAG: M48 family metallopeptidase [Dehalococcoidia bacterium]|nr:M48 family metallopeptidase [Dehalococcoidia bacterium]
MNTYGIVVLAAIAAEFLIHTIADVLNVRALDRGVPENLRTLYSDDDYVRSKRYVRIATSVGIVERTVLLATVLVFWFSGGFGWLDAGLRMVVANGVARGLLYLGILMLGYSLVSLPFSVYRTFAVEQRFGFNRTTPATFISDRLKELFLSVLIGAPLLAAVQLLFIHTGPVAWLWCWVAVEGFSLATQVIAPVLILPLFNKFEPMPEGALRKTILDDAGSVRFPVENVYVMDGSKRSSRGNAYFTGIGRHKRIALFDTLLEQQTIPETVAVLAHEVGHHKRRHVTIGLVLAAIHSGIALYLLSFFLGQAGLYSAFFVAEQSVYVGLALFMLLYTPISVLLSVGLSAVSRRHEFQADRFSLETAPEPEALPAALKKLAVTNLSNPNPHAFYVFLNYSHPPLGARLRAIDHYLRSRERTVTDGRTGPL